MERIPTRREIGKLLNEPSTYARYSRDDLFHVVENTLYGPDPFNPQYLTAVGTHHITDPRHWYYADHRIPGTFRNWVGKTSRYTHIGQIDSHRAIIAEGLSDAYDYAAHYDEKTDRIYPDFASSVQNHWSEIGLLCAASDTLDIPLISGEPEHFSEFALLIRMFPERIQEIIDYYILREGPLFNRKGENGVELDPFMNSRVARLKRHLGKIALRCALPPLSLDYGQFKKRFRSYFGRPFEPEDADCNLLLLRLTSAELEDESFAAQPVARIAPEVMRLRDIHLGRTVFRQLAAGRSVFIWYGLHHTLALSKCFSLFGDADIESYQLLSGLDHQPLNQSNKGEGYIFYRQPTRYKGPSSKGLWLNGISTNDDASTKTDDAETTIWQSFSRPRTPHPLDLVPSSEFLPVYYHLEELSKQPIQANTYIKSLVDFNPRWYKNFTYIADWLEDQGLAYDDAMPSLRYDAETYIAQMMTKWPRGGYLRNLENLQMRGEGGNPTRHPDHLVRAVTRMLSVLNLLRKEEVPLLARIKELFDLYVERTLAVKGEMVDAIAAFDTTSLHFAGLHVRNRRARLSQDLPAHITFEYLLTTLNSLVEGRDHIDLTAKSPEF